MLLRQNPFIPGGKKHKDRIVSLVSGMLKEFNCPVSRMSFAKYLDLKGLFTNFFLLFKSHIFGSNGVWYSWFWPEASINALNSTFLGFYFVPRDLDSRRHKGPRLAAQGTSTRGAVDLSQGPMAPRVEVPCAEFWVLGFYRPLRPNSAVPHPITTFESTGFE